MQSRKIHIQVLIIAALLVYPAVLPAQDGDGQGGTNSNFADFGFGARALGMGQAFVALADDPTAVFWNPAGLDYIYQQSVTLFHASLYEGALYDFIGYAYPTLDLGTFAIGIGRIGVGDVVERNQFKTALGSLSYESYRGYFSYGLRLPWDLAAGASLTVERRAFSKTVQYGSAVGVGVGLDLGFLYRPNFSTSALLRDWSFGLNVQNLFSPQIKEGDVADALPLIMRFGIMRTIRFAGGGNGINVLLDLNKSAETDLIFSFGTEYNYNNLGKIRLGFDGNALAFGGGIEYNMFQIDYAFGNPSTDALLDPVHRLSLTVNFGINRDEMFDIVEQLREIEEERIISEIRESDKQRYVAEHLQQAQTYFQEKQYLDAIGEFQNVISVDPFNQRANIMLDSSKAQLDNYVASQRDLAISDAVDKERTEADLRFVNERYEQGRLYLAQKQYTDALIEFNIALERDPDNQIVLDGIATTNRLIRSDLNAMVQQARREFENQNYSEALRLLSEARLLSRDDPQVKKEVDTLMERVKLQENIQKGLMLYDIGNYEDALQVFEDVLQLDPQNKFIQQYLTRSKIESADDTEKMDPTTERRYLEGVDKFLLGQYREAITIWEEILKEYPYNKKVLEAISGAQERLKRQE